MRRFWKHAAWRLVVVTSGTVFFMQGCDAQTRATVEDGIITSSSSLLGAVMQAFIAVTQQAATTDPNSTTT